MLFVCLSFPFMLIPFLLSHVPIIFLSFFPFIFHLIPLHWFSCLFHAIFRLFSWCLFLFAFMFTTCSFFSFRQLLSSLYFSSHVIWVIWALRQGHPPNPWKIVFVFFPFVIIQFFFCSDLRSSFIWVASCPSFIFSLHFPFPLNSHIPVVFFSCPFLFPTCFPIHWCSFLVFFIHFVFLSSPFVCVHVLLRFLLSPSRSCQFPLVRSHFFILPKPAFSAQRLHL